MEGYITKNQAIHAMEQVTQPKCFIEDTRKDFAKIIDELPAADVAPVVHARWEVMRDPYGEIEGFLCSCGHESLSASNYCPECGARMGGEFL